MNAIEVSGLGKAFAGRPAVSDLNLSIRKGELFAFLGPNGSGKTTTMRILCGLLTPDEGEGMCLGFDLRREQWLLRPRIGYMSQHFSLYEDLTVDENLDFVISAYDMPKAVAAERKQELIERFSLQGYAHHLAAQLSGGWKQRLALACALLHGPDLLILDEPTSGIDPEARSFFWQVMQAEAERGMTAMISTHYLDEVQQYCDRMAYILNGRLKACGTPGDVVRNSGLSAVRIAHAGQATLERANACKGVLYVAQTTAGVFLTGTDAEALRRAAMNLAPGERSAEIIEPRLEEVFQHLAGKA